MALTLKSLRGVKESSLSGIADRADHPAEPCSQGIPLIDLPMVRNADPDCGPVADQALPIADQAQPGDPWPAIIPFPEARCESLPAPGWVEFARSLTPPRWDAWRARAKAIEAGLPRPGSTEAIEESMRRAWLEMASPSLGPRPLPRDGRPALGLDLFDGRPFVRT